MTMDDTKKNEILHRAYALVIRRNERAASLIVLLVGFVCGVAGAIVGLRLFLLYFACALIFIAGSVGLRWVINKHRDSYARN